MDRHPYRRYGSTCRWSLKHADVAVDILRGHHKLYSIKKMGCWALVVPWECALHYFSFSSVVAYARTLWPVVCRIFTCIISVSRSRCKRPANAMVVEFPDSRMGCRD